MDCGKQVVSWIWSWAAVAHSVAWSRNLTTIYLWLRTVVALSHPPLSHHTASVLPAPRLIPTHGRLCPCSCSLLACIGLPEPLLPGDIIPLTTLSDATPL